MSVGADPQSLQSIRHKLIAKDITLQNIKQRQTATAFVNQLDIAAGLKELLTNHGYTLDLLIGSNPSELAEALGIDNDVAKVIIDAARRSLK